MNKRTLTGNWYLKKNLWGNYKVWVEVKLLLWDDPSEGNGGGDYLPEIVKYEKARDEDILSLGIQIL